MAPVIDQQTQLGLHILHVYQLLTMCLASYKIRLIEYASFEITSTVFLQCDYHILPLLFHNESRLGRVQVVSTVCYAKIVDHFSLPMTYPMYRALHVSCNQIKPTAPLY